MNAQSVFIVGSGLAGYTVAREFRKLDAETPLVILSADHGGFYSKPMLSNALAQKKTADALLGRSAGQMAEELKAEVRGNVRISAIDSQRRELAVNGEVLAYGRLVLAVGADPIRLPLQGDGADAVLSVNDLDDYRRFRSQIEGRRDIAILGAGLIGCEFANDLTAAGYRVTVVDLAPQPLGRLLPAAGGEFLRSRLEAAGVNFHFGTSVQSVERHGQRLRLNLASGAAVEADVVLSAIGLKPRVGLAQAARLRVNRGIVVDRRLRTSAEEVYAIGDCAEVEGRVLPFVMPIMHAARTLAAVLAGRDGTLSYPAMPVVVKTPACPAVVSPPDPAAPGEWRIESVENGVRATFLDAAQSLLGFALLGAATAEKNALAAQLPAVMA